MNNNIYNQFQQNVAGMANTMMTQIACAEKGIDYNAFMQNAQQAHLQSIMQQEQARVMENMVKRHYGGNQGLFGKIKEVFAGDQSAGLFSMGAGMGLGVSGVQQPLMPVMNTSPASIANMLVGQPSLPQQPQSLPFEDTRINTLEQELSSLKDVMVTLVNSLNPQQPSQPQQSQQPQQQQANPFNFVPPQP